MDVHDDGQDEDASRGSCGARQDRSRADNRNFEESWADLNGASDGIYSRVARKALLISKVESDEVFVCPRSWVSACRPLSIPLLQPPTEVWDVHIGWRADV